MSGTATATPASRTRRVLRQAGLGLASRLGAVAATFAATPLMLHLLGSRQLGVWLVLLSIFQWITLFDLGVSSGARNEIARAAAAQDHARVRSAIATGWLYVGLISLVLFALAALVLALTPARSWLTREAFGGIDAGAALWVVAAGACLSFATGYVQSVYAALEKASAFSIFSLICNVLFLALLGIAQWLSLGSMQAIAVMYLLAIMGSNAWLIIRFCAEFPQYRPRLSALDHGLRSSILNFGLRLFVIQLAVLVIFTTSRLMASMLLGPQSVVVYDAGFKIFSIVTMAHTLIMSTLWSSFTHAYENHELAWIQRSLKRLIQLMLPLAAACAVLAAVSPWLVTHWLGADQVGTPMVYALFAGVTLLSCWSNIFAYFLNGIGDTGVQLCSALAAGVVNIPATYFFTVHADMGIAGILMGTLVSTSFFSMLGPVQVMRILKKKQGTSPLNLATGAVGDNS
jgi:O-antigen/teichoic acid export membrane protein